jgi:hypothetical protein
MVELLPTWKENTTQDRINNSGYPLTINYKSDHLAVGELHNINTPVCLSCSPVQLKW